MALTPVTTETIIARNFAGLFGKILGFQSMNAEVAKAGLDTDAYLNVLFLNNFANATSEVIANLLVTNTGITDPQTVADATEYVIWVLDTNIGYNGGKQFLGAAIDDILDELRLLEGGTNEQYGAIAAAWNVGVDAAVTYAQTSSNTDTTFDISDTAAPVITAHDAVSYAENAAADAVLATISATDNVGVTGFEITTGNDDGFFAISATGEITLTEAGVAADAASNDFETTPNTFTLGVVASDAKGNKSAAVDVVFNVTDVDDTAPSLVAATLATTTVKLNFNETLQAANLNGTAFSVVDANNANITVNSVVVSGTQVTLTLATTPSGAVKVGYTAPATGDKLQDAAGNAVADISNQTAVTDVTAPTLSSSTPADNATAVATADNLVLTFSEDVLLGTGNITIVNAADATDTRTIGANDATQVSVSGKVVTINPTADLKIGASYYVNIPATAVLDLAGNVYAGITGTTALNFSVATTSTPGSTFVLTKAIDDFNITTLKATVNDDIYIASIDAANAESTTLNTGDVIDGGAGTDKIEFTRAAASPAAPSVTIKNIETIQIRDADGTGFDLSNADTSVANLINAGSGASTTFANAANKDMALTVKDVTTSGLTTTVTYKAGVLTGSADTAAVTLNNVAAGTSQVHTVRLLGAAGTGTQGIETVAITSTGTASKLAALVVQDSAAATTLSKLTVAGDKDLSISTTAVDFVAAGGTVDASTFTGKLSINLDNGDNVTVTGGSGDDTFLFGATLNSSDSINGGLGTDTLGADTFTLLQAAFDASRVSNIEAIRIQTAITASGSILDVSKAGNVNAVTIAGIGANSNTLSNLADNSTVTLTAAGAGTIITNIKDASLAGTANTLNVNLGTAADTAVFAAGTITAAGVETININSLGTVASGTGTNTVTLTANADLSKIVVTGSEDLTVTLGAGAALRTFDANAATGIQNTASLTFSAAGAAITGGNKADVLTGGTGNDTIIGGAGNDTIDGGTGSGSDVLTGGDGVDTFTMRDNGNTTNMTNPVIDTITDFVLGSGGDAMSIANLATRPTLSVATDATKIVALNAALPASTSTNGLSEVIVLDSSITDLQAANASALNAKLFNLSATGYGNVIVAYSDSATGNTRLATATISGNDIGSITDFAVLQGVTTAAFAAGFHANNLADLGVAGLNLTVLANTTATGSTGNDTFTAVNNGAFTNAIITGNGGNDALVISAATGGVVTLGGGGAGGTISAGTTISTIETQSGGALTLAADAALTNVVVTNSSTAAGLAINLGNNAGAQFNGASNGQADTVTFANAGQRAALGNGDIVTAAVAGNVVTTTTAANETITVNDEQALVATFTDAGGVNDTLALATAQTGTVTTGAITGYENLNLSAAAAGGLVVTLGTGVSGLTTLLGDTTTGNITVNLSLAQLDALATITSAAAGNAFTINTTVTAGGSINLSDTTYTAANIDTISFANSTTAVTVTNTAANQAVTVGFTGSVATTDQIILTTNAVAATFNTTTAFETITLQGTGAQAITTVNGLVANGASLNLNNTGNGALTFIGDAETDGQFTISAGTGGSTINSGRLVDTLTLGSGIDKVSLGTNELVSAARDIINSFGTTDVFNIEVTGGVGITGATLTGIGDFAGANSVEAVTVSGNLTVAATTEVLKLANTTLATNLATTSTASFLDGTSVLAALGGTLTGAVVGQNNFLIAMADTSGNVGIYYASSVDNAIIASEIALVGVLTTTTLGSTDATGLVTANFSNADLL